MKQASLQFYTRFKSAPKFVRVSTYLSITYLTYAAAVGLIAPAVIESQAPKQIGQLLGREIQVEKVSINPFLLRAKIDNFAILESNRQQTFTQFKSLEVELNFWRSLFTLTPTVDHITLVAPQLRVENLGERDNAQFNFSDILQTLEQNAEQEARSTTETDHTQHSTASVIPAFRVNKVSMSQGRFQYTEAGNGANLAYRDLALQLDNIDSQAYTLSLPQNGENNKDLTTSANKYSLSLSGENQSAITLDGQFQLSPLEVKGDISIEHFALTPYWPFAKDQIEAKLTDGKFKFASQYHAKEVDGTFAYQTHQGRFELLNLTFNDQQTEKLKLPSLIVDGIELSSDTQTIDITDINMQGLWADAILQKNGLDLATLFSPKPKNVNQTQTDDSQTDSQEPSTEQPWLVTLNQFVMNDSDFNLTEKMQSQGVRWRVFPMSLKTGQIQSDLQQPVNYDVALTLSSSTKQKPEKPRGKISTQGSVDVSQQLIDGKIAIYDLDLTQLQPYLTPYLNIKLTKGALTTQGQYNVNGPDNINVDASASIANLSIRDTIDREPLIKWNKMSVDSLRFNSAKNQLFINTISLNAPYAKVMITEDQTTNIGDLVVTQESGDSAYKPAKTVQVSSKKDDSNPMSIIVKQVKFNNGSAFFADNSLTPNFASGIELLDGSIKNLSSTPGTKAIVDIEGKVDKYAPVTLKGEINPLIEEPYLDLALIFKSVELTSVNPYSGTYAGYYIDKGQLSLDLNYQLENNQLQGTNHVIVDQLQLGKPSDSSLATSLPITLAIAILQDRHGVIDLGVDVSGDVDDPDFSFGGVILQAFANVITKAVTAPFSLLADLVGADDELNDIAFQPGLATLDEQERLKIEKLAQALAERPILRVNVEGSVSAPEDSHALAEQQIQQSLLVNSGIETLPQPFSASRISEYSSLVDALEELAENQLQLDIDDERDKVESQLTEKAQSAEVSDEQIDTVLHMGLYNQLVTSTNIDNNKLSNLAANRAKAVKAYLVEEQSISPDRVFLLDSKTDLHTEKSGAELTVTAE